MGIMDNSHRRYFQVAGITLQVESDLHIRDTTFHPKFGGFEVSAPGEDVVVLRHHSELPHLESWNLDREVYHRTPWIICQDEDRWVYLSVPPDGTKLSPDSVAVFNRDHSCGEFYSGNPEMLGTDCLTSLTHFPTDQILLGRLLADRQACILHSSGVILNDRGLLFLGHSEAGKSTMAKMLASRAEILCDDRVIVRRWPDHIRIHGTWSHGEVPITSAAGAPLLAAFFLTKSDRNRVTKVEDYRRILGMLLSCLIKPLCTSDWWEKTLTTVEALAREIRWYDLEFDKTGAIADLLQQCTDSNIPNSLCRPVVSIP
jgi:hypothetical protein